MEVIMDYVVILVALTCWCVGYILRHIVQTDRINRFIPLIMGVLGVFLNVWVCGWRISPEILLGGLASGLASTGANELVKHLLPEKGDVDDK